MEKFELGVPRTHLESITALLVMVTSCVGCALSRRMETGN